MEKLIKVIEVWLEAEESLLESTLSGSFTFTNGYHKGYIKALNQVRELLSAQPPNKAAQADRIIGGLT